MAECSTGPVHEALLADSSFDDYRADPRDDAGQSGSDFVAAFEVDEAENRWRWTRRKGWNSVDCLSVQPRRSKGRILVLG